MKVEFKDTFFESVERLVWYDTKLWKVWEFIRRGLPTFIGNIWRFRKELYSHRWWDYRYTLEMLHRSLTIMIDRLEKDGIEEDNSRGKKVTKIKRAIQLLDNRLNDNYIEQAEKELGVLYPNPFEFEPHENGTYILKDNNTPNEREHNSKVFRLAQTIDDREWRELWNIFKGQSILDYKKHLKTIPKEEQKTRDVWNEWFNGSDMRGWWD
jgi:hypothetical protein